MLESDSGYETFTLFFKQIPFPLHPSLTRSHCHNNTWANFRTSKMSVPELPYSVSDHPLDCLRKTLYMVWFLLLFQFFSRCIICNDGLLVQGTNHILSGDSTWVTCVVYHEFAPYTTMVLTVFVENCAFRLPIFMLRFWGLVGIASTCLVSRWIGVRGGTISIRGKYDPNCIGSKWSDYWMFSLPVWHHLSRKCVVAPVVTIWQILQKIFLVPLIRLLKSSTLKIK